MHCYYINGSQKTNYNNQLEYIIREYIIREYINRLPLYYNNKHVASLVKEVCCKSHDSLTNYRYVMYMQNIFVVKEQYNIIMLK